MSVMTGVNIALDLLGVVITAIVLGACLEEKKEKELYTKPFLAMLITLIAVLLLNAVEWMCDGRGQLRLVRLAIHTLAEIGGYAMLALFIQYLRAQLPRYRRGMTVCSVVAWVLFGVTTVAELANLYFGFNITVNEAGYLVQGPLLWTTRLYPTVVLLGCMLTVTIYPELKFRYRILFLLCPLFSWVGLLVDYAYPAWSLTYMGALVGMMLLYTNHYLQKRRTISEQRTALMVSQINPHFMYNTLTTIASLCEMDPKSAKELTIEFSGYLRGNLDTLTATHPIPFDQEMKHVECYLKIEKARFRDKLNIVYNLNARGFGVPALTVQPLVENAVRCGLSKKTGGGTLKIQSYDTDTAHVIEIIDDGVGFDPDQPLNDGRTHVGIENVRNRLKDMCGGTLTIKSVVGIGTRATVEIPIKRKRRTGA